MCSDFTYILKVGETRLPDRFNVVKEKRVRGNSKIHSLSLRRKQTCHLLILQKIEKEQVQGAETGVWSLKSFTGGVHSIYS